MSDTDGSNGGPLTVALIALEAKRNDDLRKAETRRVDDLHALASTHRVELATAEAKRLDANAEAEKERVNALLAAQAAQTVLANTRTELEAKALAEQVKVTRETLAAQVEARAQAVAAVAAASALALAGRIEPLEKARYEQAGRSGISTPLLALLASLGGAVLLYAVEHLPVVAK